MKLHLAVLFLMAFLLLFSSCNAPKYTILFDSGKYLDFSHGKWLLNDARSNSRFSNSRLYPLALKEFREILGDSLFEIHDIRRTRLLPREISFDMNRDKLLKLSEDSGCDYLINIKGRVITEGIGSITLPNHELMTDYSSNESSVSIRIFHLKTGIELSSSSVYAKSVEQASAFGTRSNEYIPTFNTSSDNALLSGAKKLIGKYKKYGTKRKG